LVSLSSHRRGHPSGLGRLIGPVGRERRHRAIEAVEGRVSVCSLFAKDGTPKLVSQCTDPLTGKAGVSKVFTDLVIIGVDIGYGATVYETFGISFTELTKRLDIPLHRSSIAAPVSR
jgi:acyl CoA:acetate/3-ketoacid CoA transferase beta subunit